MSPDTISSLFPDRPIRPLPKRRLREKLSPESAVSIKYPPSSTDVPSLFYYPPYHGQANGDVADSSHIHSDPSARPADTLRTFHGVSTTPSPLFAPKYSDKPLLNSSLALRPRQNQSYLASAGRSSALSDKTRQDELVIPVSTDSSVDGYDSLENTSNKKKRKIPTAADPSFNTIHSLTHDDGSHLGSGSSFVPVDDPHDKMGAKPINGSAYLSASQGISGSGRGRLARSVNVRAPLRPITDGNNSWLSRVPKSGVQWSDKDGLKGGIISQSIAKAEKMRQGQENVSLLQPSSTRTTAASSQFTFTCESQVTSSVPWPGYPGRGVVGSHGGFPGGVDHHGAAYPEGSLKNSSGASYGRRRSRRKSERELEAAARHRKDIAAENYYHNPPKMEDIWICEFCEYERIFGEPPRALIRDYEIKDRRHRQEEADRKRLLEKAKAKSRKGKKVFKTPAKGAQGQNQESGPLDDATPAQPDTDRRHSTQSDSDSLVYDDYRYDAETYSDPEDRRRDVEVFEEPDPPPARAITTD